ncbi:hypothetical protein AGMMS4957_10010 [Bacteroidia bacterium]|nr:hypothetical protein AGMMS4957_10010 [Bacteroidia bacterium]
MKKIYLMMAVAVLGAASASAQKKWTYGFEGGGNTSGFSGALGDEFESKPGLHWGIVYDYAFNEKFSITPEFLLFDGGATLKSGGEIVLHYGRIPINATYKIALKGKFDMFKVLVFAGPYVGHGTRSSGAKPNTFGSKTDGYRFNPWDFGLNIGVGLQTGKSLFWKLQYSHGLTNVQNDLQGAKDGGNTSVSFTIGHLFFFY